MKDLILGLTKEEKKLLTVSDVEEIKQYAEFILWKKGKKAEVIIEL